MRLGLPVLLLLGGCSLIDQTTFNPEAGKRPAIPPAPVAAAARPVPPGPPAFLTLSGGGDYRADIAKAVAAARARRPDVAFDVVEIVPPTATATGADAASVARSIEAQGVPASRVRLMARPEPNPLPREVRVYVR